MSDPHWRFPNQQDLCHQDTTQLWTGYKFVLDREDLLFLTLQHSLTHLVPGAESSHVPGFLGNFFGIYFMLLWQNFWK
jgi:hypothetical protein